MIAEAELKPRAAAARPAPASTQEVRRVMDIIEKLSDDWLYHCATPEGRVKLLREHGIIQ